MKPSRNSIRRAIGIVTAAAAAAVLAAGCATGSMLASTASTTPKTVTLVLFDLSRSTSGHTRETYLDAFDRVLADTTGQLGVDVIDDNPLGHASLPLNETLAERHLLDNGEVYRDQRTRSLAQVSSAAKALLDRQAPARGTALVDSLDLAQRYFANYPGATTRRLVILSDMLESSDRLVMRPGMSASRMQVAMRHGRSTSTPLDLRGVHVYVVGAGVNDSGRVPPALISASRTFWLQRLTAAGADAPASRFGPTLVAYP